MIDDLSALKHEFDENGFVIVENVFTTDEFAAFDDALGKIICQRLNRAARDGCDAALEITTGEATNKGLVVLAGHDRKAFDSVYDTVWQVAPFLRMVSKEYVVRLANTLLGLKENSPLYGYINRCKISLPDDPSAILDWHREIFQRSLLLTLCRSGLRWYMIAGGKMVLFGCVLKATLPSFRIPNGFKSPMVSVRFLSEPK
jgi:hypothetical protein